MYRFSKNSCHTVSPGLASHGMRGGPYQQRGRRVNKTLLFPSLWRKELWCVFLAMAIISVSHLSSLPAAPPTSFQNAPRPIPARGLVCRASLKTNILARDDLLGLIQYEERGLRTQQNAQKRLQILKAIDALGDLGSEQTTTDESLSATWRMLWTTEKEQLFIIEKAYLFGTKAGDILQVSVSCLCVLTCVVPPW